MAASIKISELPKLLEPTTGSLAVMVDSGITHYILASDLFNNNLDTSFNSISSPTANIEWLSTFNITGSQISSSKYWVGNIENNTFGTVLETNINTDLNREELAIVGKDGNAFIKFGYAGSNNPSLGSLYNSDRLQLSGSLEVSGSTTMYGDTNTNGSTYINGDFYKNGNKQFNYLQVIHTGSLALSSANTAYTASYSTTQAAVGFSVNGGGTQIAAQNNGLYNVQFSFQFSTTNNQASIVEVWFKKNGQNIDYSNSVLGIPAKGYLIASVNNLIQLESGSYLQLCMSSPETISQYITLPPTGSPSRPVSPAAILSITQVA